MPFWLQLVGAGLTTTWAAHLGAVLSHATWSAVTCVNLYSHQLLKEPIRVESGYHRVPEAPGLGVEVDEKAVERYRVSAEDLKACADRNEHYQHPRPRIINSVIFPDGSCVHLAFAGDVYPYFCEGHGPANMEGVRLRPWHDDGSKEWNDLYERAKQHPVRSRWVQE